MNGLRDTRPRNVARAGPQSLPFPQSIRKVLGFPLGVRQHATGNAQNRFDPTDTVRILHEQKIGVFRGTVDLLHQSIAGGGQSGKDSSLATAADRSVQQVHRSVQTDRKTGTL